MSQAILRRMQNTFFNLKKKSFHLWIYSPVLWMADKTPPLLAPGSQREG